MIRGVRRLDHSFLYACVYHLYSSRPLGSRCVRLPGGVDGGRALAPRPVLFRPVPSRLVRVPYAPCAVAASEPLSLLVSEDCGLGLGLGLGKKECQTED